MIRGFRPDRLKELRKDAGMSVADVARMLDVASAAPWYWENGGSPEVETLPAIAELFNVPIDELVYVAPAERMPSDMRVRKGLRQVHLATQCGVSTTALSNFERGETKNMNKALAQQIALVLGVSDEELACAWRRARSRPPGAPA